MSKHNVNKGPSEAVILGRLLGNGEFSPTLARFFLTRRFTEDDKVRMHELALKNQAGALSAEETEEMDGYAKAGCILGILQSTARKTLRKRKTRKSSHG
jgi:hypothetical protein